MFNLKTMKQLDSSQIPDARWDFVISFQWPAEVKDDIDVCQETFILPKPKCERLYTAAKMAMVHMCDLCVEAAENNCSHSEEPCAWGKKLPYVPTKISEYLRGWKELHKKASPGSRFHAGCLIIGDNSLHTVLKFFGCLVVDQLPDELREIAESGPNEADREAYDRIFEQLTICKGDSAEISKALPPMVLAMFTSNAPEKNGYRVLPLMVEFKRCHALKHFRGDVNTRAVFGYIFKLPPGFSHGQIELEKGQEAQPCVASLHRRCSCCGAVRQDGKPRFKVCANCEEACYCNKVCQKRHWPTHKAICKKKDRE